MRRDRALVFAAVFGFWALLPAACSTSQTLVGAGGQCLTATDCQPGLVCIPANGQSTCSSDLTGIQKVEGDDGGTPQEASAFPEPEGGTPPVTDSSTGSPDTSTPPVDASKPVDSGVADANAE